MALLGSTLLGGLAVVPANASSLPTLTGETLSSTATQITTDVTSCTPDGMGIISFTASGTASGPYPGTFIEFNGTAAAGGPATAAVGTGNDWTLTAFQATFQIKSGTTVINGTKFLNSSGSAGHYAATCNGGAGGGAFVGCPPPGGCSSPGLLYSAPIGTFQDAGTFDLSLTTNPASPSTEAMKETFVSVPASPTLATQATASTTAGGSISDTANLSGGNAPTGFITFSLFGPNDPNCSAAAVFTSRKTVTVTGMYSSASYTAVSSGTYRWIASYSGDATDNPVVGSCNGSSETSAVTACPLSLAGPAPCGEQFASSTTPFPPGFGGSATVIAGSKTCNADGSGSLSFTADGTATGAFPGPFHEEGRIVLAATAANGITYVTSADARFTITSAIGSVSGTKSFNTSANPGDSAGSCNSLADNGAFLSFQARQQQTYQATIMTAQGRFSDSGTAGSSFQTSFQGAIGDPIDKWTLNAFTEGFQTSNGVVTVIDTDLGLSNVPANISTNATSSGGAAVNYTAPTALDEAGDSPVATVSCDHASGSTFAIGTTTVTCTATDADDTPSTVTQTFTVTVQDVTPPVLSLPADITVEATGALTVVNFTATASDLVDGSVPVTCSPSSGSSFAVGVTTVICSAADASGNRTTGSFHVTVLDTDLALTGVPANITTNATSPLGATVTFTPPIAVDEETPPAVSCDHASGSTFPIGTTTVTCSATDGDDLNSPVSTSFTVTVNDTDLALTGVPDNITTNATGPSGATVTFTPPIAIDEETPPAVSCDHASGSTFPIGTTTVTCSATDTDDLNSPVTASFTVTVNDTDLGLTGGPGSITTNITGPLGAMVIYAAPTAIDEAGDSPAPTVNCSPASGSTFAVGTTTVTCTATSADDTPGTVSGTFTVTVVVSPAGISNVVAELLAGGCINKAGIANALITKLTAAAQEAIAAGHFKRAINILGAFIRHVQKQNGKHILAACTLSGVTFSPAAVLISDARSAIDSVTTNIVPNPITGMVVASTGEEDAARDVTVSMVDSTGTTVATTTSDETGFYFFATTGVLMSGEAYTVTVTGLQFEFLVTSSEQMFTWSGATTPLPDLVLT